MMIETTLTLIWVVAMSVNVLLVRDLIVQMRRDSAVMRHREGDPRPVSPFLYPLYHEANRRKIEGHAN